MQLRQPQHQRLRLPLPIRNKEEYKWKKESLPIQHRC